VRRAFRLALGLLAAMVTAVMASILPEYAWTLGWIGCLAFFGMAKIKI
jgi:hypothetical protein